MKKLFSVAIVAVLAISALAIAQALGYNDAAKALQQALSGQGYNCQVEVGDVDENGGMDFAIKYIGGNEDKQVLHLIANITGGVAAIVERINWRSDKVFVLIGEDLYWATTTDCVRCYNLTNNPNTTDDEVVECLSEIWNQK